MLRALRAQLASVEVEEAGGRFVSAACAEPCVRKALQGFGAAELLESAARRHLCSKGVQDQALWGLACLQDRLRVATLLRETELASSPEAACAALWCLGEDVGETLVEGAPWAERHELAALARALLSRYPDHVLLARRALQLLGAALDARAPDAMHSEALAALPDVVSALQWERRLQRERRCLSLSVATLASPMCSARTRIRRWHYSTRFWLQATTPTCGLAVARLYYCVLNDCHGDVRKLCDICTENYETSMVGRSL